MILILSQEYEPSTADVIDWIQYFGGNFNRINDNELIEDKFSISIKNSHLHFDNEYFSDVNIIWYRRGLTGSSKDIEFKRLNSLENISLGHILKQEKIRLINDIFYSLKKKKWLSNPSIINRIKKVEMLNEARYVGLKIPDTLITNSKKELLEFFSQHNELIVKPINEVRDFTIKEDWFFQFTNLVTLKMVNDLENHFFPSLFQERLIKKYEIRSFYLNQKIYSMAIFSQNDPQTEVDFRAYNEINPNRTVPYNLPLYIEEKLIALMDNLGFITGSIDLIKTVDNEFVFLEINPVGQFGMVSYACNYPLEKNIARYLIMEDNEQK